MVDIQKIISKPGIERSILAILLKNKDKVIEANADNLFAEHFSIEANQVIYSIINYLSQDENIKAFDPMLVYNQVTSESARERIEEAGGLDYIESLFISPVSLENLYFYIKQVKETSMLRQVYDLTCQMQEELRTSEKLTVEEVMSKIQEKIFDVSLKGDEESEVKEIGQGLKDILDKPPIDGVLGYALGWEVWDKITQGLCPNDLTVICAESKTGKSTLLMNMSVILSYKLGIPGLYIDTEMTSDEQQFRALAMLSGVPFEEIRNRRYKLDTEFGLAETKVKSVTEALELMDNANLYHIYLPSFSADQVTALIRRYKIKHNIGYFVFDYIKLPDSEVKTLGQAQEYQKLGYLTSTLKNLCGICSIPGITACQTNRTAVGSTNQDANQIGGSYRILQIATRLCFLRNKQDFEMSQENFSRGNQVLKIAYQRNGSSDGVEIDFNFEKPILRMSEIGKRGN